MGRECHAGLLGDKKLISPIAVNLRFIGKGPFRAHRTTRRAILCTWRDSGSQYECVPRLFAPMWGSLATKDTHRAGAVLCLILVAMFAQGVAQILASSRYAYALARDKGQSPLSFRFRVLRLLPRQPYPSLITSLTSLKRNGYHISPFGESRLSPLVSGFRLYP